MFSPTTLESDSPSPLVIILQVKFQTRNSRFLQVFIVNHVVNLWKESSFIHFLRANLNLYRFLIQTNEVKARPPAPAFQKLTLCSSVLLVHSQQPFFGCAGYTRRWPPTNKMRPGTSPAPGLVEPGGRGGQRHPTFLAMIEANPSHFNELILVPQFFGASVGPVHCTSTYHGTRPVQKSTARMKNGANLTHWMTCLDCTYSYVRLSVPQYIVDSGYMYIVHVVNTRKRKC